LGEPERPSSGGGRDPRVAGFTNRAPLKPHLALPGNQHTMTNSCATCGIRPASVHDFALRGGRWVQADLCDTCAQRRRRTVLPLLGAAASTLALAAGAVYAIDRLSREERQPAQNPTDWAKRLRGGTPTLSAFSRDLTAAAREGTLDPVIGRDDEVERVISILARRSKNNPVLVGEPGVGKTAVVEGLAQRIVRGEVPDTLRNKRVLALAIGPLVAGTKYRGEFEGRVKRILEEVRRAARDIVLFIDELHTLVGAGAAEGSLDLSSLIKPELARGDLQCIGATTFDEYRKHIEADAALERRFQPVMVAEPTIEQTEAILRGLRSRYAEHHGVAIGEDAIEAAAALSARYIVDRFLPDKAIDLMDEAAASVALKRPRGPLAVTPDDVSAIVSKWTGIPQGSLTEEQTQGLLALEESLAKRVVGQDDAIAGVAQAIRRGRAGLKDPRKPVGGFLFVGPSGVGKTELALAIAGLLFGTDDALVRIDLSEYTESHTVSRLLGAPPGYAGHDEAGQLTEPVRRRPYCVVLFDEFEKAHTDVAAILLQILDDGRLTDAKGRTVDFRHAIVILTSNLDADDVTYALRPELLNRLDDVVRFRALGVEQIEQVVEMQILLLGQRLGARHVTLVLDDDARRYIAHESIAAGSGARYVARTIARLVTTPLSNGLLRGDIKDGANARVTLRDQERIEVIAA
jgi:ATP-dependent Clp protease ATP-binding subunit ClpC